MRPRWQRWLGRLSRYPFCRELFRCAIIAVDVYAGAYDARRRMRLRPDAIAGELPERHARPWQRLSVHVEHFEERAIFAAPQWMDCKEVALVVARGWDEVLHAVAAVNPQRSAEQVVSALEKLERLRQRSEE